MSTAFGYFLGTIGVIIVIQLALLLNRVGDLVDQTQERGARWHGASWKRLPKL